MNILVVAPRFAPAWSFGGGVRITYELAREWVRRGNRVTVYTSDQIDAGTRARQLVETIEGIKVIRFRNRTHTLAVRHPYLFFGPVGLKRAIDRDIGQHDIVHVTESRGPHNRWVSGSAHIHDIPYIWSAYGGLADGQGVRRLYRKWHDKIFNTRSIVKRAAGLIAQTEHEAAVYDSFGADRKNVRVIPLAISADEFSELPAKGAFRNRIGVSASEKMILFVGRMHETKGLDLLIKSFALVLGSLPEARLVIVGWDHGYLMPARRLAKALGVTNRIVFLEPVYGGARLQVYVDADLFVMTPRVYEETSLAALEAAACGVPCVLTRQCEIPGIVEEGGGAVVAADQEEVCREIVSGLRMEAQAVRGANARRLVLQKYTTRATAVQHEEFFSEIIGARSAAA